MIVRANEAATNGSAAGGIAAHDAALRVPCIYCGSVRHERMYSGVRDRLEYVDGEWAFERCLDCDAALLSPRPKSAELGSFYPPVYTFAPQVAQQSHLQKLLARLEYLGPYRWMYRSQAKQIARLCQGGEGKRLLDVGCGRGLRLLETRRRGFEVQGVDFDPAAVEYLRETHGIPAVACDVLDLRQHFAAESFDAITAYYVVEHVVEVDRLLRDALALLRPGGWLVVAVPLIDGVQARWLGHRWCQVCEAPRHVSLPSVPAMQTAMEAVGFVDLRVESDSYLLSASSIGLSLVPSGTTNAAYAGAAWLGLVKRVLAAGVSAAALPFAVWEGAVARRPSLGVIAARRPL